MKKYVLPLLTVALAGYGSLAFTAESKSVVIDEVPESVKVMNALTPEEQMKRDEAESAATESFNAAADASAQKNPNR
jgi:hypothetical protein